MKITKKRFVLIALFIFPLLFFLILSTGINNFERLPTLNASINWTQIEQEESITFKEKITILCFMGNDVLNKKGGFFNLNQKIYKEFYDYRPFQIIALYPEGSESDVTEISSQLKAFTDMSKWQFVALTEENIQKIYKNLKTNGSLDQNLYSNQVFLLDKDGHLRGRTDDKDSKDGYLYGYNMESVAELNNKMEDDVKVLLYEYRAALKDRRKADRKKVEL